MKKRSRLTLLEGSFETGFPAILQISFERNGTKIETQVSGRLPPAPEVGLTWQCWQQAYRQLATYNYWRMKAKAGQITNISYPQLGEELSDRLNHWLNQGTGEWQKVRDCLQINLDRNDEIEILIQTGDRKLQQLPWHLWDFFDDYPYAEIALSTCEYQKVKPLPSHKTKGKVKILAILGDRQGINLDLDRAYLEQLSPQAEIKFLVEPPIEELNDRLWETGWDILFFAGHSSSQEKGRIWLNPTDILSLEQLKYALRKAINNGLRLAIFNSCDGLGLARELADLQLGQIIVMREPVADAVAQTFLRYFLSSFAGGESLYSSVRTARERLQKLETKYPYATWLPVIFQNPGEISPTWQDLAGLSRPRRSGDRSLSSPPQSPFLLPLVGSIVATALVLGLRQLGILQPLELKAFDSMMRMRPDEGADPRLLLVTITEKDIQNQNPQERRSASLADSALTRLLEKIKPHQPQVIGLDIYRDFAVAKEQPALKTYLEQAENFVAVCEVGEGNNDPGISPPPEIASDRYSFSNMPLDSDGVIRRQLLGMAINYKSLCQTEIAFSLRVAQLYLASQNISIAQTTQGHLKIGDVVFQKLQPNSGGYHQLDARGFQILLNYRSTNKIAQQVTLTEILNDYSDAQIAELVKNRLVLIGTIAPSFKDYFPTPYSTLGDSQEMPGLFIQSHMVSQILSAVEDKRPLLWYLSEWGESLWIWGWNLLGGMIILCLRTPKKIVLASIAYIFTLSLVCFLLLLQGGWLPLVPSVFAIMITIGIIQAYKYN